MRRKASSTTRSFARRVVPTVVLVVALSVVVAPTPALADPPQPGSNTLVWGSVWHNGVLDDTATVTVDIWPNEEVLSTLLENAEVETWTTELPATDGWFAVTVDPASLPAKYLDENGSADVIVTTTSHGNYGKYHLSLLKPDQAVGRMAWVPVQNPDVVNARLKVIMDQTAPSVYDYSAVGTAYEDAEGNQGVDNGHQQFQLTPIPPGEAPICGWYAGTWYYGRPQLWLRALSYFYAPMTVTIEYGSQHSLGVAVSYNYGGSWSQGGTVGLTATSGTGAGSSISGIYDKYIRNKVNYREFIGCYGSRQRRPMGFYDLIANDLTQSTTHTFYQYCADKASGGEAWKVRGSNIRYSAGLNVGGVNLSSQAVFSQDTKVKWTFKQRSWLCGSNAIGWPDSATAEANSWHL